MLEEVDQGAFFIAESSGVLGDFLVEFALGGVDGVAVEVGLEDCGVDVAFAADGRGVAEAAGDGLDGFDDVALGFGGRGEGFKGAEEVVGEDGAGPCAEVFGCEIFTCYFAQIIIHILRGHVPDLAVVFDILE